MLSLLGVSLVKIIRYVSQFKFFNSKNQIVKISQEITVLTMNLPELFIDYYTHVLSPIDHTSWSRVTFCTNVKSINNSPFKSYPTRRSDWVKIRVKKYRFLSYLDIIANNEGNRKPNFPLSKMNFYFILYALNCSCHEHL